MTARWRPDMVLSIESTMAHPKHGSLQHAIINAASGPDLPEG
jgi:hypothetical protein